MFTNPNFNFNFTHLSQSDAVNHLGVTAYWTLLWLGVTAVYETNMTNPVPKAKPIRRNQATIWVLAVVPLSRTQGASTIESNKVLNSTYSNFSGRRS